MAGTREEDGMSIFRWKGNRVVYPADGMLSVMDGVLPFFSPPRLS